MDVVKGLCELDDTHRRAHGNLNQHNVVLVLNGKEVRVKLKGMRSGGSLDDDLLRLGHLIRYCLQKDGKIACSEGEDLLYRIFNTWPLHLQKYSARSQELYFRYKSNFLNILRHPFFWDNTKCLRFIEKFNHFCTRLHEMLGHNAKSKDQLARAMKDQNSYGKQAANFFSDLQLINTNNWVHYMALQVEKRYLSSLARDLLRYLRDRSIHYLSEKKNDQDLLGTHPEEFYDNFRGKEGLRHILISCYRVLEDHLPRFGNLIKIDYFNEFLIYTF